MRTGSPANLEEGASVKEQSSTVELEPMSLNYESKENDEGEDESGEENEEYNEDPWYQPNTLSVSTQLDTNPTPALTSQAEANPDPEQAINNRKELKRELMYQIENAVDNEQLVVFGPLYNPLLPQVFITLV
jgi:hypothetical protein